MTTLKTFTEEFLLWSEGAHRGKTVKANSLALRKFAAFVGAEKELTDIAPKSADLFMANEIKQGNKISTANNYFRHLKAAFRKAVAWGYVTKNIFDTTKEMRSDEQEPVFLNKQQMEAFIDGIEDPQARLLVTAYLATGRRRAELVELRWEDVDINRLTYRIGRTKGRFSRTFPIGRKFLQVLMQCDHSTEFVFQRWRHPDSVTHIIKEALVKAGFPKLHSHHLRHSYASLYLQSGGDIRALKDLLGHKNIKTTMIYSHLTPSHLAQEADKVNFL